MMVDIAQLREAVDNIGDLLDAYEGITESYADYLDGRREIQWCTEHEQGSAWAPIICCNSYYNDDLGKCEHSVQCRWEGSWLVLDGRFGYLGPETRTPRCEECDDTGWIQPHMSGGLLGADTEDTMARRCSCEAGDRLTRAHPKATEREYLEGLREVPY